MVIFEMKCKKLYIKNARNKNYIHLRERERERERERDRERERQTDRRGEKDTLQKFVVNRRALVKFSAPSWVS